MNETEHKDGYMLRAVVKAVPQSLKCRAFWLFALKQKRAVRVKEMWRVYRKSSLHWLHGGEGFFTKLISATAKQFSDLGNTITKINRYASFTLSTHQREAESVGGTDLRNLGILKTDGNQTKQLKQSIEGQGRKDVEQMVIICWYQWVRCFGQHQLILFNFCYNISDLSWKSSELS